MAKVALNTMVAPETLEAIRALATGKSQGQVIDELIAGLQGGDKHGEINRWFRETWERLDEVLETVQSVPFEPEIRGNDGGNVGAPRVFDPVSIPGVQRGVTSGFPCRCVHSGCKGSKFQGASKYANLCPACEESGHRGDRHDCKECLLAQGGL